MSDGVKRTPLSDDVIRARIEARKMAKKAAHKIQQQSLEVERVAEVTYWDALFKELRHYDRPGTPAPPEVKPMSDVEAAGFERKIIPYGREANKRVGDADLTWLDWLVGEQNDEFKVQVRRYLANPHTAEQLDKAIAEKHARLARQRAAQGGREGNG